MKKYLTHPVGFILMLVLMMAMVVGCGNEDVEDPVTEPPTNEIGQTEDEEESADEADSDTWIFTDSAGREVELPTKINRVIPSGPLAQMFIYSVNPDKMIGWSRKPNGENAKYYDDKYLELPDIGFFYGDTFNLEALLAESPDIIIDVGEAKKSIKEDMDEIQEATGIPTIFVEATLETIPEAYEVLGKIMNEEDYAEKLALYSQEAISDAQAFTESTPVEEWTSIFYGVGEDGLRTNGKGSFHAEIFDFVGLENVAVLDDLSSKGGGNEISMEQLIVWQPDAIVLELGELYEDVVQGDPLWKDLQAVKDGQTFEVPSAIYNWLSFPPSNNRILGIKWLGNLFYPDHYDYDMVEEAKEFYRLFFHYDLSDEEAKELLANSTLK